MMPEWSVAVLIPLGAFVMAIIIVAIINFRKMRERELQAHQDLRMREMEHDRQLKQLEIEKAKVELEIEKSKGQKVS
jgi:hypothetical protein